MFVSSGSNHVLFFCIESLKEVVIKDGFFLLLCYQNRRHIFWNFDTICFTGKVFLLYVTHILVTPCSEKENAIVNLVSLKVKKVQFVTWYIQTKFTIAVTSNLHHRNMERSVLLDYNHEIC